MKTRYKLAVSAASLILLTFGLYAYKYKALAMEGWRLFNDRCNNVNPLYIKTRDQHSYLSEIMAGERELENPEEELIKEINNLNTFANEYLEAENNWLNSQRNYTNRWDFQLLEPEYVKKTGYYQIKMYESQYNYYKTVSDFFSPLLADDQTRPENSETVIEDLDKYSKEMQEYRKLYFEAFEEGQNKRDLRKFFGQVPKPDCPEENLI